MVGPANVVAASAAAPLVAVATEICPIWTYATFVPPELAQPEEPEQHHVGEPVLHLVEPSHRATEAAGVAASASPPLTTRQTGPGGMT
jgi:hypothetical protein